MSIFRNTFTDEVQNQLDKRQKALQKRSANDIIYLKGSVPGKKKNIVYLKKK